MRYVRLNNNTVAEVGYFDSIEGRFHPSLIWLASDVAEMGDLWDGEAFTTAPATPAPIPQEVTMRQACLALEGAGLLDDVEAIVATLPRVYQIEWQRASVVLRSNALVEMVRQQQSMTEAQIDALFVTAATL